MADLTKKTSRSAFGTLNNPQTDWNADTFGNCDWLRYMVFQKEQGANGTVHYQFYMEFTKSIRWSAVRKQFPVLEGAHLEVPRHRAACRDYCMKEDSRIDAPVEIGSWESGGQGKRNELREVCEKIKNEGASLKRIAMENPEVFVKHERGLKALKLAVATERAPGVTQMTVICLLGDAQIGKSTWVHTNFPNAYWKPAGHNNKWFCNYQGQDVVVFDDFCGNWFTFDLWKRLCQPFPCIVETKLGQVEFNASTLIFTCNTLPTDWYSKITNTSTKQAAVHYDAFIKRFTNFLIATPKGPEFPYQINTESFGKDYEAFKKAWELYLSKKDTPVQEEQHDPLYTPVIDDDGWAKPFNSQQ